MTERQYKKRLKKHFKEKAYSKEFIKTAVPIAVKIWRILKNNDKHIYRSNKIDRDNLKIEDEKLESLR